MSGNSINFDNNKNKKKWEKYAYEKYHPQIFLEECKYGKEKIKTKNYIDKELKSESDIMIVIVIAVLIMKNKFQKK